MSRASPVTECCRQTCPLTGVWRSPRSPSQRPPRTGTAETHSTNTFTQVSQSTPATYWYSRHALHKHVHPGLPVKARHVLVQQTRTPQTRSPRSPSQRPPRTGTADTHSTNTFTQVSQSTPATYWYSRHALHKHVHPGLPVNARHVLVQQTRTPQTRSPRSPSQRSPRIGTADTHSTNTFTQVSQSKPATYWYSRDALHKPVHLHFTFVLTVPGAYLLQLMCRC